jgi:putative ABC transport system permease protein
MNLRNILLQSFASLALNPLRSALTMLGVIWGTASVVFLLGWGKGFVNAMESEVRSSGEGYIIVWPNRALSETAGRKGARKLKFELKEVDVILDHCPSVRYATPFEDMDVLLKRENRLKSGMVIGVNADGYNMYNVELEAGRFLHPDDMKNNRNVIVLGADLKEALFPPGLQAVGKEVKVQGIPFEVIGTLKKKGERLILVKGPDDTKAYVPVTTMLHYLYGSRNIYEINVQPKNTKASNACIDEIKTALAKELNFSPDDPEALEILNLCNILNSLDTMSLIIAVFVTVVGVITLFVGAVGVMNIMLISVTERTREIGVCKAIGARRKQIWMQFLAESLAVTTLSGIIGILVGCGISLIFAAVPRPKVLAAPELSFFTIGLAFLIMALVGMGAGIIPAIRAAAMDPAESLRYE